MDIITGSSTRAGYTVSPAIAGRSIEIHTMPAERSRTALGVGSELQTLKDLSSGPDPVTRSGSE